MANYVPPFELIRKIARVSTVRDRSFVNTPYEEFVRMVKLLSRAIDVDEEWYLATYPDVAEGVRNETHRSGKHHFVEEGYFEGRLPFPMHVDEDWYLSYYPDVKEGVAMGAIPSAQEHFFSHGLQEGRLPGNIDQIGVLQL